VHDKAGEVFPDTLKGINSSGGEGTLHRLPASCTDPASSETSELVHAKVLLSFCRYG